ncbi:hypothetical protein PAXRUDRAFT_13532 [Paxillus rubicundulus Ve08.2h10]|uniref:Uncharacterized protein n=1 Tax=Paxillus rubicundulus Ve08.2h10 TaxID=930991 RepID=A0A0D0D5H9_9AGAM|nr:hypothetical protein PAXRUDRAFT_13532 [Paxillus rubicundulus Ve08.2h10]
MDHVYGDREQERSRKDDLEAELLEDTAPDLVHSVVGKDGCVLYRDPPSAPAVHVPCAPESNVVAWPPGEGTPVQLEQAYANDCLLSEKPPEQLVFLLAQLSTAVAAVAQKPPFEPAMPAVPETAQQPVSQAAAFQPAVPPTAITATAVLQPPVGS